MIIFLSAINEYIFKLYVIVFLFLIEFIIIDNFFSEKQK
jgi:hypothetical protein